MTNEAGRTLFLAVPGTQDTRELDIESIRGALARGEIALDNWAWSQTRNEWVPLAQLPEFAPAAAMPVQPVIVPVKVKPIEKNAVAVPVMKASVPAGQNFSGSAAGRAGHAATYYSKPIQEHNEFPIFKVLFFVLGVIITALVVVNYFLVDQPLRQNLARTPFASVQVHAHLAAFVQPTVMLIHVMPNPAITSDNFADFLTALTKSAPRQAIAGTSFNTISLTSKWLGQYAVPSSDWNGFADMSGFTPSEKRDYVLSHLERINGAPLVDLPRTATAEQRKSVEDRVWAELVGNFSHA